MHPYTIELLARQGCHQDACLLTAAGLSPVQH